jgi:nitrogen fixation protein NifU and related proteins
MNDALRDLYQEVILDHSRRPRNFGQCTAANRTARGNNPLCGDRMTIHLTLDDGVVSDVSFEGNGCAISIASASLMTEAIKGLSADDVRALFDQFRHLVTVDDGDADLDALDKLAVFAGVREFPVRVKCATLAWHTLTAALEGESKEVSTEE